MRKSLCKTVGILDIIELEIGAFILVRVAGIMIGARQFHKNRVPLNCDEACFFPCLETHFGMVAVFGHDGFLPVAVHLAAKIAKVGTRCNLYGSRINVAQVEPENGTIHDLLRVLCLWIVLRRYYEIATLTGERFGYTGHHELASNTVDSL